MKTSIRLTAFAITLLASLPVAIAADSNADSNGASTQTTKSAAPSISNTLSLTSKQQTTAWRDIAEQARKEETPANFIAKVGAVVPSALMTYPVPMATSSKIPALRRYQYALLENNELLIVNPNDKKVADVITH